MADVSALFANRKHKKGGSRAKKPTNFNTYLEDLRMQQEQQDDSEVLAPEMENGDLTTTMNTLKIREEPVTDKTVLRAPASEVLVHGDWVDDDNTNSGSSRLLNIDAGELVDDLESAENTQETVEPSESIESNKKLFHWTRMQAMQNQQQTQEPAEAEKSEAPKVYRPRHIMEAKSKAETMGELHSTTAFPTLGKKTVSSGSTGAWGQINHGGSSSSILADETETPQILSSTPAAVSNAWGRGAPAVAPEAPPAPVQAPAEPKPLSPEELEQQQRDREEKERKRQEKKKEKMEWERQNALAIEREAQQEQENSSKAAPGTVETAPTAADAPSDRFAGLKKKKKKKKDEE